MSIYKEEKLCIYDENEIDQSNARIQKSKPIARSSSKLRLEHSKKKFYFNKQGLCLWNIDQCPGSATSRPQGQGHKSMNFVPRERSRHMEYVCKISNPYLLPSKVIFELKVFWIYVKGQCHKAKMCFQWKGLVTRNTHLKYKSPISYG